MQILKAEKTNFKRDPCICVGNDEKHPPPISPQANPLVGNVFTSEFKEKFNTLNTAKADGISHPNHNFQRGSKRRSSLPTFSLVK